MLKLIVAVVALALVGTVSAEGWRALRFDASSDDAFAKSVETFKDKLSPAREYVFGKALQDIWTAGTKAASAEQREYTDADYYAQVHGLSYKELVTLTDPTGDTAKDRYRTASLGPRRSYGNTSPPPWASNTGGPPPVQNGAYRGATRAIDHQQH
jgi:hypothetical protein